MKWIPMSALQDLPIVHSLYDTNFGARRRSLLNTDLEDAKEEQKVVPELASRTQQHAERIITAPKVEVGHICETLHTVPENQRLLCLLSFIRQSAKVLTPLLPLQAHPLGALFAGENEDQIITASVFANLRWRNSTAASADSAHSAMRRSLRQVRTSQVYL